MDYYDEVRNEDIQNCAKALVVPMDWVEMFIEKCQEAGILDEEMKVIKI